MSILTANTRIKTRIQDCDTDDSGALRIIPPGTIGTTKDWNGETHQIDWENGATTMWTPDEILADAEILTGEDR